MAHRIINSKRLTTTEVYSEIYIDNVTDLAEVDTHRTDISIGSVAYTLAPIMIYHKTDEGWKDSNGTVVS